MTQLELPLCSTYVVRIQSTIDITVPAESGKAAKRFVEQHYGDKVAKLKIIAVYRADMLPAKEENEGEEVPKPPGGSPRGRPSPGGTQGGGSVKPIPKPVDAIAKAS